MNVQAFLEHHGLTTHPFDAEEARLDPIFDRLIHARITHPAFGKILGRIDQPATSIVFGEKGSGKTAIRLMMAQAIARHNRDNPTQRVITVAYDDLNPLLDALLRANKQDTKSVLKKFHLEHHQDAILSLAVTRLVTALLSPDDELGKEDELLLPEGFDKRLKKMPVQKRRDLALLAALYDQPASGSEAERFVRLRKKLRLGRGIPSVAYRHLATLLSVLAAIGGATKLIADNANEPWWLIPAMALAIGGALLSWGWWAWLVGRNWKRSRDIAHATPAVGKTPGELRGLIEQLNSRDLATQPLPAEDAADQSVRDSRYQLTRRLVDVLGELGYVGMIVLVDRMDEPTAIAGDPDKMRAVVWPMLDNKFLKQDRIGLKLLLPIELRHLLRKESAQFFQEARLDKQNLIDRLEWSGTTLYDLCNARLRTCRATAETSELTLRALFTEDVSREMIVDALDQMHQPRDAFKFLYQVIQEHCQITGDDQADYRIPRLTLDTVRRTQSQRVQDLHRGLGPA